MLMHNIFVPWNLFTFLVVKIDSDFELIVAWT